MAGDADLHFALARYNTDGSLDTTFDGDGIVTTACAGFAIAWAVAIQPDGRIVAAGGFDQSYLARYNSDGSLDLTFGVGGRVTGAPPSGWFTAVAIQADGRIVAAGRGDMSDDFLVWRYNTDGSPDVAFGTGGMVLTDFGGVDHVWGLAIQGDGKIVAVGTGGNTHFALARYTGDGHLDPSFDGDGMVITPFSEEGFDQAGTVVIQTNGKIVVAGSARLGPFTEFDYSFALARYNTDGGLDPTFGTGGTVTTDFEGFRSDDVGHGVALHADGRIVVAGRRSLCNPDCSGETFALVRYLGDLATIESPIDIRPGSTTNPINLSSAGVVPVAMITSDTFDATTVAPSTVCFGDADGPTERDCTESHGKGHLEDVNGDGRPDQLFHFKVRQTGIDAGDTTACLTATTFDDKTYKAVTSSRRADKWTRYGCVTGRGVGVSLPSA